LLNTEEKKAALVLARHAIGSHFEGESKNTIIPFGKLKKPLACFVTLYLKNARLRGCIGTLEANDSLFHNIQRFALAAAFDDPRFAPLERRELSEIILSISILGPLKPLETFEKVEIGKHGLSVENGSRRGVLLAKVPVEFGWNREQFIRHTCKKACLNPDQFEQYAWSFFEEQSFSESDFT
jgi:AmmeMemoRadiSam system protein A